MHPAAPVVAIPDRLAELVRELRPGDLRQPPVHVERGRWRRAVGRHLSTLDDLPEELDRLSGRAFALGCPATPAGALAAFIASQIWGFGTNGYGPHRLGEALTHPALAQVLLDVRARLAAGDAVGAFRTLCVQNEIPHVGAAFGSKFLYFADPHGRALILDRLLRAWLAEHAGVRLHGGRDEREYAMWLLIAEQWAKALEISAERLELVIFTDALPPSSAWHPEPRPSSRSRPTSFESRTPATPRASPTARVVLLGCVKQKLDQRTAAKDLFISTLWNGRRAYAEASGCRWLILSAKYGLLAPDQEIAPYDVALARLGASARREWGKRVVHALQKRYGSLSGMAFEVHAGEAYRLAIQPGLRELGADLEEPLRGLTMGRQLAWYSVHAPAQTADHETCVRRRQATSDDSSS